MQQYWARKDAAWQYVSPAEMRDAFAVSKLGQAAAAELAEPPERTEQGAAQHDLASALAYPQQENGV